MIIFDGHALAKQREDELQQRIQGLALGQKLTIAAVLFSEDAGSRLYTKLKGEAAGRVGIEYRVIEHSVSDDLGAVLDSIESLNFDETVTGIIIQKPYRKTWKLGLSHKEQEAINSAQNPRAEERKQFAIWWQTLTSAIAESKDVDGLHPNTITEIKSGTWKEKGKVLPATCKAVLTILENARHSGKHIILGKSDLLGVPLFYELQRQGIDSELIAKKELDERIASQQYLLDAGVIVSATGVKNLITGAMVSEGVVVVDVGEPSPDVEFETVSKKAAFITPVPGGVGPMTVVSLLENCVDLYTSQNL